MTLIHLIGIPLMNLSVNPARSTGPALFVGGWALEQLWLFWIAPIIGAALAGIVSPLSWQATRNDKVGILAAALLGQAASRCARGRWVRSLTFLSALRGCAPVVPDVRTIEIPACQQSSSASC